MCASPLAQATPHILSCPHSRIPHGGRLALKDKTMVSNNGTVYSLGFWSALTLDDINFAPYTLLSCIRPFEFEQSANTVKFELARIQRPCCTYIYTVLISLAMLLRASPAALTPP